MPPKTLILALLLALSAPALWIGLAARPGPLRASAASATAPRASAQRPPARSMPELLPLEVELARSTEPHGSLHLVLASGAQREDRTLGPSCTRTMLEGAQRGSACVLAALDETTHEWAHLAFVHDGSPRALALEPALRVRGRLVESASRTPVLVASVRLAACEDPAWSAERNGLNPDFEGWFGLLLPASPPLVVGAEPTAFALSVQAHEFLPLELDVRTRERHGLDLGEIGLELPDGPFALAPGHGLSREMPGGLGLAFGDEPGTRWRSRLSSERPDGSLVLRLDTQAHDEQNRPRVWCEDRVRRTQELRTWTRAPGSSLVLYAGQDPPRLFERQANHSYALVRSRDIRVQLASIGEWSHARTWIFGWKRGDVWAALPHLLYPPSSEDRVRTIEVPADANELWWSTSGLPPELCGDPGGSQRLDGQLLSLELP